MEMGWNRGQVGGERKACLKSKEQLGIARAWEEMWGQALQGVCRLRGRDLILYTNDQIQPTICLCRDREFKMVFIDEHKNGCDVRVH